jgi:ABC-type sugar transport system permease subunit
MKARVALTPQPRQDLGYRLHKVAHDPKVWFVLVAIVPLVVWYGIFAVWALLQGIKLAFTTYHLLDPSRNRFVGWDNFRAVFADPLFGTSLRNSAQWGILLNLFGLPIELGIAMCLASVRRFRNLYQTIIFVPVVLSLVSIVVLARYLLDPMIGPIDRLLTELHLPTSAFLQSSNTALPTLVGFAIWKGWGITIVILTAGLLNIPKELLEAAAVDGANGWRRFWRITLPLLQPTLNFVIVLGVIGALQEYTIPVVMTGGSGGGSGGGGPDNATTLLNMYIYSLGIGDLQFGQAAAASLVEFAITIFLTLVVLRALRMRWSY